MPEASIKSALVMNNSGSGGDVISSTLDEGQAEVIMVQNGQNGSPTLAIIDDLFTDDVHLTHNPKYCKRRLSASGHNAANGEEMKGCRSKLLKPAVKTTSPVVKVPPPDEVPKDPYCDPDNPVEVTFQEVSAAAFRIRDSLMRTPCTRSDMLSKMLDMEIYFKKEFMHVTGSFKERGIRNTLMKMSEEQRKLGTITASAGNHALALSYHCNLLKIPVTVIMPIISPLMKINRCRQYNANVIVQGANIYECKCIAMGIAKDKGLFYINGYDHPDVIAGNGTAGLETIEQVPDADAVLVPVGGAGLIAGVSCAIKYICPTTQVIGVEADSCPSFTKAIQAGKPEMVTINPTLADGLSVPLVGYNAYKTAMKFVDKTVTVSESEIALAILRLVEVEKAVVEGAGAVGLAALIGNRLPELKGKKVAVLLCGGNIDTAILGRCLERGLAEDGRLIEFKITVTDRPGGSAEVTHLLMKLGVSIRDIFHERAFFSGDIFSVRLKITAETRDREHARAVEAALKEHYQEVIFDSTYLQANSQSING